MKHLIILDVEDSATVNANATKKSKFLNSLILQQR